jgi:hypothetical protein
VRTKDNIQSVRSETVLGHRDFCAQSAQLVSNEPGRIHKTQRMHIPNRLHDGDMHVGKIPPLDHFGSFGGRDGPVMLRILGAYARS